MTKPNLLFRASAQAVACAPIRGVAAACLAPALFGSLLLASPAALAAGAKHVAAKHASTHAAATAGTGTGTGEDTPLNLAPATNPQHVAGSGSSIVRTIVGLAIVIAVIWGLSWILRQVKSSREPHASSAGLTSLAALTLSSGRSVHLVRAGSDYLLIGSAEHGVVPLHRYTEEEARDAGLTAAVERPARTRRPLLRPPEQPLVTHARPQAHASHDPMRMPSPGPGTSLVDRLRELTVRR